jgi:thiol-disulfide isomerase/thioredoxin
MLRLRFPFVLGILVLLGPALLPAGAGSDTPPEGPPWTTHLIEAQTRALAEGKPIFCYFTKTYCPHCVKVEAELLSNPALQPVYDRVVWLYDYQDFTKDARDREAERIAIRFGVTSWPQLFLVDPESLTILCHTGRQVEGFLDAVARTKVGASVTTDAAGRLRAAEARAVRLEEKPTRKVARVGIDDDDIVVRTRALGFLAEKSPDDVVKRAAELLAVPNDPFRFRVCEVLRDAGDAKAAAALEALVREPEESLNPNVLRIRAVQALATCGGPSSLEIVAPHATSGAWFNGLTGQAIDAMVAIADRHPRTRPRVRELLKPGYPVPPEDRSGRDYKACVALARRLHAAIDDGSKFPDVYDAAARARLMK